MRGNGVEARRQLFRHQSFGPVDPERPDLRRQAKISGDQERQSPAGGDGREPARCRRPVCRAEVPVDDRRAWREPTRNRDRVGGPHRIGEEIERWRSLRAGNQVEAGGVSR